MANILCNYDKKYGLETTWDDMSFDNPKEEAFYARLDNLLCDQPKQIELMRKIRCTQKQLNEPRIVHSDNKSTNSVSPPPAEQPLILLLSSDDDETLDNGSTDSIHAPP